MSKLSAKSADRDKLLESIGEITLAEGTLDFQYDRKSRSTLQMIYLVSAVGVGLLLGAGWVFQRAFHIVPKKLKAIFWTRSFS